jgi:predicted RNA-binding Zn-ribbon protein involved in translation (DUF1610 family)
MRSVVQRLSLYIAIVAFVLLLCAQFRPFTTSLATTKIAVQYGYVAIGNSPLYVPLFWVGLACLFIYALARRKRLPATHDGCASCGYDLTGNQSGACPECGAAVNRGSEGAGSEKAGQAKEPDRCV